jgi:RNA polymerase sigma-70 factor (ECF subfamily)
MDTTQARADSSAHELEHRALIFSIAYRMLGRVSEAEDIVQEAYLRLHRAREGGTAIDSTRAWLSAVTTRLVIDRLRSAQARRETYVGTWLPEPLVEDHAPSAERMMLADEGVSMAFLVVLESLSPAERAVFLLRQVFEYEYAEIAAIVGKSEENCRQIHARARRHVEARHTRFEASSEAHDEIVLRFVEACRTGDLEGLEQLLARDARFYGDGGGKASAVATPLEGASRIARFFTGLFAKGRRLGVEVAFVHVNGEPGLLTCDAGHRVISAIAFEVAGGTIVAARGVVNPDKLRHLGPVSDLARLEGR